MFSVRFDPFHLLEQKNVLSIRSKQFFMIYNLANSLKKIKFQVVY